MIPRTSLLTITLSDAMASHARTVGPMSADVTLRICDLLRVFASQCEEMERRLAGDGTPDTSAANVIYLGARIRQSAEISPGGDA